MLQQVIDHAKRDYGIQVKVDFWTLEELHAINTERGAWGNMQDDDGNPVKKHFAVLIQDDIDNVEQVITFAHELGHIIDVVKGYGNDLKLWNSFNSPSVTMFREHTAWRYAVSVLKHIGFTQWDRFIITTSYSIGSYYLNTWYPWTRRLKKQPAAMPKIVFLQDLKTRIAV